MIELILDAFLSTIRDVIPIAVILFGFQVAVLRRPIANLKQVLMGFVLVIIGLSFFLVGLELALFPLGEMMAVQLTMPSFLQQVRITDFGSLMWFDYYWVYLFAFCIGFSTQWPSPL